jgi:hypothetical protein
LRRNVPRKLLILRSRKAHSVARITVLVLFSTVSLDFGQARIPATLG